MRYPLLKGKWVDEIDYNVIFNYKGGFPPVHFVPRKGEKPKEGETWEAWQALGFDHHSVWADPLFLDPVNGDFRVKPGSPALKLGFCNFDTKNFGLLPDFPETWQE